MAFASVGEATPLTKLALLNRCYAHLVGLPLPLNHPFRTAVASGADPISLCENLVGKAILDDSTYRTVASDAEAKTILQNFYAFHREWFEGQVFDQMQGYSMNFGPGTSDLFDSTEPALALTYNLFAPASLNVPYKAVLQGKLGYYGLREIDPAVNQKNFANVPSFLLPARRYKSYNDDFAGSTMNIKSTANFQRSERDSSDYVLMTNPIQIGELVGVRLDYRVLRIPNYAPSTLKLITPRPAGNFTENALQTPGAIASINVNENQGGGILGLNSFILINWFHEPGRLQNGAEKMARRWVQSTFKSLLCRDVPLVRYSDVADIPTEPNLPEVAAFRKSQSCVQCHATMDPFAAVGRNFYVAGGDYDYKAGAAGSDASGYAHKVSYVIGRFGVTEQGAVPWSAKPVVGFHKQAPVGKVFFRTTTGELVDSSVSGVEAAALELTKQKDIYRCAAKRYFQHFTGLDVGLYDPGDPANQGALASEDPSVKDMRKFIYEIGDELSQHQSLRALIGQIMKSKWYVDSNYLQ